MDRHNPYASCGKAMWGRRMLKEIFSIAGRYGLRFSSELVNVLAKTAAKVSSLVL
jgi:hypothetical protein